jgi:iron complex transport system ATP-binding protein
VTLLQAEGVGVVRANRVLLSDVDLELSVGEVMAIVGSNGAGKSTLLSVLSGSLTPTSGRVLLDGRPLADHGVEGLARRRALLRQGFSVTSDFTALEVVRLGRTPFASRGEPAESALAERLLGEVGLAGFARRAYATLSGGEQQRVQLARVLAQIDASDSEPRLLLLDEPSASLDPRHQHDVLGLVRARVAHDCGAIVVLHDLTLASRYADVVMVLRKGKVAYAGPAGDLHESVLSEAFDVPIRALDGGRGTRLWVVDAPGREGK